MSRLLSRLRGEGIGATLAKGAAGVFATTIVGQALMFGMMVMLARVMGAEPYGIFVYALAWLNVGTLVAKLGFDTSLLRFIAAYRATEDWGSMHGLSRVANRVALAGSVGLAAVAAVVIWALAGRLGAARADTFWIACLLLPIMTMSTIRYVTLRALRRVVLALVPERIIRPALTAGLVGLVMVLVGRPVSGPVAMSAHLLAVVVSYVVGAHWLDRNWPHQARTATPEYRTQEWMRASLALLVVSGSFAVVTQTDTLMVGALVGSSQAGIYYSANRVCSLIQFGVVAVQGIAGPMIASYFAQEKKKELQRTLALAALASTAFAVPAGLFIVVFADPILALFGPEFGAGRRVLWILTGAELVNALTGMTGLVMTMTGHHGLAGKVIGVTALLNVILNAVLIPRMGIEGAATATLISQAAWNLPMVYYARREVGLWTLPLPGLNGSERS